MDYRELLVTAKAYVPQVLAALPVVAGILLATFLISGAVRRGFLIIARRNSIAETAVMPFVHTLQWTLRFVALVLILGVFGFEIGGIWAMISTVLGLVAIGFVAVWSLLSNVSATALILFMRPFEIGDDIEFAGEPVRGRVVNLNLFFTTLLTHDNRQVQIPNNLFFQKVLKRTPTETTITLAQQLNVDTNASVTPPSPPSDDSTKSAEPNPLMSAVDPRSLDPRR